MKICLHEILVENTIGGFHFAAGNVWDDIETSLTCINCGKDFKDQADVSEDLRNQLREILKPPVSEKKRGEIWKYA